MTNSDHEEADTRIMLHVYDSLASGSRKIMMCTVDTDVVVILIGEFHNMVDDYPMGSLWNRETFLLLQHQHYLCSFRERTIPLSPTLSCIHRMRYHIQENSIYGMLIQRSTKLLSSCLRIVMLKWILHHHFSFCWRDSLFYFMTKLVSLNLLMKHG